MSQTLSSYQANKNPRATTVPQININNTNISGLAVARAPLTLPLLVLPRCHVDPEWPLEVARTDAGTVAVFSPFDSVVVENVCVVDGLDSE
jgi:hypothetical protein